MKIFRFFREEAHADALARGEVWLSTLERCRGYEDARGDHQEGLHFHHLTDVAIGQSQEIRAAATRIGIEADPGVQVSFKDVVGLTRMPDAYVLCFSTDGTSPLVRERFGEFGVEVLDRREFGRRLASAFTAERTKVRIWGRHVTYAERSTIDAEPENGPLGFVKPLQFADEAEYRLLIVAADPSTRYFLRPLHAPNLAELCRRL